MNSHIFEIRPFDKKRGCIMYLKDIKITNFRNYNSLSLQFDKGINIIYGKNGQGKTNLLESLYVLGMTKSHRSYIDNNLLQTRKDSFKLVGNLYENGIKTKLEQIFFCHLLFIADVFILILNMLQNLLIIQISTLCNS